MKLFNKSNQMPICHTQRIATPRLERWYCTELGSVGISDLGNCGRDKSFSTTSKYHQS
jgi:hypothetical protein